MPTRAKSRLATPSAIITPIDQAPAGRSAGALLTRERILQAARELVMEQGGNHLTLDAVVARAGLSKGAFLYHFKTKRDLLVALIDELIRAFEAEQADHERQFAGDPDPWLSSQVAAMPDAEVQAVGAALLAAVAEDRTLLEPVREWYGQQYERAQRSPRGSAVALIVLLALEGTLFLDMLGLPSLEPTERRRLLRTLQGLAAGDLQIVPTKPI